MAKHKNSPKKHINPSKKEKEAYTLITMEYIKRRMQQNETYKEIVDKIIVGKFNLLENKTFIEFANDVVVNTFDNSATGKQPSYIELISVPVLDRFINLFASLAGFKEVNMEHLTELGLAYNLGTEDKAQAFNLVNSNEYMLRF